MFPWTLEGTVEFLDNNKVIKRSVWELSARDQFRLRAVRHVHSELLPSGILPVLSARRQDYAGKEKIQGDE
jgi:hypothetical protein